MTDVTFPADLVELQRAAHTAWAALEAHRKQVDAARRKEPRVELPGRTMALRPWTPAEDAEHARLRAAVTAAQEAVRAGIAAAPGLGGGYDTVQGLHRAARAGG